MSWEVTEEVREVSCERHGRITKKVRVVNGRVYGEFCPTCTEEREAEEAEATRQYEINGRLAYANLPPKFKTAQVSDSEIPPQVQAWLAALKAKATSGPLVMAGSVGTGKTHLAVALLRRLVTEGARGTYVSAIDYGRRVRETWTTRKEDTERSLLETYATCGILVLDELGANRSAEESIIQDLICGRYDSGGMPRTIIVTNLAAAALEKAIGERATDRIREGATLVTLTGMSRRRPAA